ncbi:MULTISPECIES: 4-hydroxythreonine-4-phosphate dehydrogenase PdxA [Paenibacillus]|uniref:4-hydroxythreonine-4-phosphate dehydrogenase PdxA n=1 Tax=Paenibacillus TaxID=44249 RepID=UPI0022B89774|nr:4-hydroxythreonine-4-phosphate dehydrogenase PdxA [Paenibacillus caseinilyticus]MCZ8519547.1 4-hydroxythreonine-4-phosphate dehydrogenase PdxA [Paenibacillus caseinilyticus]
MKPLIGITMGDAAGVGPEIIVKALAQSEVYDKCRPFVIGDPAQLERAVRTTGAAVSIRPCAGPEEGRYEKGMVDCTDQRLLPTDLPMGVLSAEAGHAAYLMLKQAVEWAAERRIDAICTAPLNKEALHRGGHLYPGHTEILAALTGSEDYSMMLSSPRLKVIHLTTHVGLIRAISMIDGERTYKVIKLAHDTLVRAGVSRPRIAVCGINPHAGENGLFGCGEEEEKLLPGIRQAQSEGIEAMGPYPADTVFYRAVRGDFDIVVACYHDQGHIPIKVLGLEEGVNITVGLKGGVIRTSVDHGTAFDIAGTGRADERSLLEAIRAATELAPRSF